jgi:S-adenosylmethionine synthetase
LAKNIVAAGLADKAEVRLAYFIGAKKPLMQEAETFGTEKTSLKIISNFMNKILDTSVHGILEQLDLRRPIYKSTAAYGHFGRDGFSWEKLV